MFKNNKIIQFFTILILSVCLSFGFYKEGYGAGFVSGMWSGVFSGSIYSNNGIISNVLAYGNGANLTSIEATNVLNTIVTKTSSYLLSANDSVVILNGSSLTATLPTAVGIGGYQYTIIDAFSGSATVATTSSQTINGSTTYTLSSQYNSVTVQSDGANWWIISTH